MATSNFKVKNGVEVTEVLYVSGSCSLRNVGILGPVDPDVSGITVHGDISASGTIFVAGSAIGGSSSSSLASGAGGSLNELQYNNSGILDGAAGLIYQESDGYLGLGISNAQERLTVAGNISGAGSINIGSVIVAGHVDGRNIAEDAASVVAASGTWDSVYSTFKANSAEYESTFATLKPNSGGWTDTESTVRTNSGTWTAGASLAFKTIALSGNRPSAAIGADIVADSTTDTLTLCAGPNIVLVSPLSGSNTDVITISGAPNTGDANVNTTVNVSSGSWDSTNTTVKGSSGSWDSTNTTVRGSSGSWDSTNSTLNANSARYDRTALSLETNVVPNSARYGRTALSLETNVVASTANWNSTYNQVQDSTTDLNVDSGTLVVDKSANRVGIGTTAPNKLLTVVGDVSATGDIYASSLIADGETLYFRNVNGTVDRDSGPKISTTQGGSVVIQASTTSGAAGTVVVITSAGTVASVTSGQETRVEIGGYPSSFTTSLSTLATVFASGGNSKDWNSTYNVVKATSATWTDNIADIAEIAALSATWTTAYTRSNGVVTIHSDVSDAGSGAIITGDERDKFTRAWTNVSSNSSQWAEVKADIAEVAGVSATWTTAYTRSNGVVTIHSDVSDAGSGQIITADERDKFTRAWTNVSSNSSQWAEVKADIAEVAAVSANWTTGYDNSLLSRADLAGVASVSANWTTAYGYKQFKTVTLSANRAAAAIGADVVADSATDTITLCAGPNIVLISDPTNDVITISGSAGGGGGGGGSGDENVNTAVRGSSGSWDSTNTTLVANSSQWAEVKADIAEVAAVSANWTTAYTRSNGVVTIHSDVSDAGSGEIITAVERDKFTRAWTNVSGNSASYSNTFNSSTLAANSGQWAEAKADIAEVAAVSANWTTGYNNSLLSRADLAGVAGVSANWTTGYNNSLLSRADLAGVAVLSGRWSRTALSLETNVVPATGSWNSTNTTVNTLTTTAGTAVANKMLIVDGSKDIDLDGGDLTATDITVQGNLTVQGDTFQVDTIVTVTSALSVINTGTGPALTVDQEGNNTIVDFRDDGVPVFTIANGGNITIKDSATFDGRDVSVDGAVLDRHKLDVANIAAVSANWTTAYNNSLLTRPELAEVASTSANWNTSYTTSTDTVTVHSDVSNAGSGAIITALERSRLTANWTDTNATSGSWNSTNTTVKSNSGLLDVTAGTVAASKALVVDSNKDIATLRDITASGRLIAGQLRVTTTTAPSSYTYSGTKGEIAYDTNYVYICVANNSWRRSPLAIW